MSLSLSPGVDGSVRRAQPPRWVLGPTTVDGLGMLIRDADRSAPVLLFQPGSPGGSEIGAVRARWAQLERQLIVATVTSLAVHTYFVDGAHDVPGRLALLRSWCAVLAAPHKESCPDAGHRSLFEKPAEFVALLTRIRAETGGR